MHVLDKITFLMPVLPNDLDFFWDDAKKFIEMSFKYCDGKYSLDFIKNAIIQTDMQLWVAIEAQGDHRIKGACVTQIVNYPRSKRCVIVFMGGEDIDKIAIHCHDIFRWSKENGCDAIEIFGRPGWARTLNKASMNFKKINDVIRFDISDY